MSELTKRVLFAVVAAPLALWVVLAGGVLNQLREREDQGEGPAGEEAADR